MHWYHTLISYQHQTLHRNFLQQKAVGSVLNSNLLYIRKVLVNSTILCTVFPPVFIPEPDSPNSDTEAEIYVQTPKVSKIINSSYDTALIK